MMVSLVIFLQFYYNSPSMWLACGASFEKMKQDFIEEETWEKM